MKVTITTHQLLWKGASQDCELFQEFCLQAGPSGSMTFEWSRGGVIRFLLSDNPLRKAVWLLVEWDLVGPISLQGANLSEADLEGAKLSGADLRWAYLEGANLSGADLRWAYLSGAYLSGADLRGADLIGAYLSGGDIIGANLEGADLRWASLVGAKYDKNINSAITDDSTIWQ